MVEEDDNQPPQFEQPVYELSVQTGVRELPSHAEQLWTRVDFETPFEEIPAVFVTPGSISTSSCDARLRNIDQFGFEVSCVQPLSESASKVLYGFHFSPSQGIGRIGNVDAVVECLSVESVQSGLIGAKTNATEWQRSAFQKARAPSCIG